VPDLFENPVDARTRYCAVYGQPIKHSASPAMQNAGISTLGLNWRYVAFEVRPDELESAIAGAAAMHFIGLNLTVPHKLLAYEMVDVLDESAKAWGAVNTIRFEGKNEEGEWRALREFSDAPSETRSHGFNTDADAITRSLKEDLGLDVRGGKVLLLGAGGAGRTAALKLAADGAGELFLVNRTESKAQELAEEIRTRFAECNVTLGYPNHAVDLLLNATSGGLTGNESPLDENKFSIAKAGAVYDMIYRPAETRLLIGAKAAGCRNCNGIGMLLYQGTAALEIWTGQPAPVDIMRKALLKEVYGL
jgi:shikimate dehydrogenase